jgi:hypothetical protein
MSNQISESDAARGSDFQLPFWAWITLYLVVAVGASVAAHYAVHGVVNGWQVAIAFFLATNIMICWLEISLGANIGLIEYWHHDPAGRAERPPAGVLISPMNLREAISMRPWVRNMSEYVYYDPSYANRRSYGFWADVGNGWVTLLPSIFFLVGMTAGMVSPVVLGIVGALIFYQKLYCTSVYFVAYVFNRYYRGRPLAGLLGIVGGTNAVWVVFPAFGLYACIRLILENRFDFLWS